MFVRKTLARWSPWAAALAGSALLAGCFTVASTPVAEPPPEIKKRAVDAKEECRFGAAAPRDSGVVLTTQERELGMLLERDSAQRHTRLVFNPVLARVAHERARDMAARN